ncbi:EamA family transporter [Nostoc sp. NIES-2111]
MSILLGLLSAMLFGLGDFLSSLSGRRIGAARTFFYGQISSLLLLTIWLGLHPADMTRFTQADSRTWVLVLVVSPTGLLGSYAFTRALAVGTLSLVVPVATGYGAVAGLLALLGGEQISTATLVGLALTFLGVAGASVPETNSPGASTRGVGWALVAAVAVGVSFWAQGQFLVPVLGGFVTVWLIGVIGLVLLPALLLPARVSLALPEKGTWAITFGSGVLTTAALTVLALGFATGDIAIVAVLSTLCSVLTAVLGIAFLGERLSSRQLLAGVSVVAGVVIINAARGS